VYAVFADEGPNAKGSAAANAWVKS
jgi:hypothetical protein